MRHYCTLFDSSQYMAQGLALYESLKRHSSVPFTLHILAMDDECFRVLMALKLENVQVFTLKSVEVVLCIEELSKTRTWAEYCWTMASNFMWLLQGIPDIESLTYLDADVLFFCDPEHVFKEIGTRSVGVIPHRFPPERKHQEVNGKFNVSWVTIANTQVGRECLRRWAEQCRQRCSAEVGCGDQLYLDEWPGLYGDECHVIENIGAGAAPWNIGQYRVVNYRGVTAVFNHKLSAGFPKLIFYHFHEWKDLGDGTCFPTNYPLKDDAMELIYKPYIRAVMKAKELIASVS